MSIEQIAREDVLALEEHAMQAWPALRTTMVHGWALRFAGGCTKRANSANALNPSAPFHEVRAAAEALYGAQGLPAIFRLSPLAPPEADTALDAAGYSLFDPSLVMSMPLAGIDDHAAVRIAGRPSGEWLDGIAGANGIAASVRPLHDAIVRSIAPPAAFATLQAAGRPVGFGLAVYQRGMAGLFDIVVASGERGHGRALAQALLCWSRRAGARTAYLQVRRVNEIALKLYASLGFVEAYAYHYRLPPR